MQCVISSAENKQEFKDITSITLPAYSGELQVLPGHAESFIILQRGQVFLDNGEKLKAVSISGGVCCIKSDSVSIML
jgi:F0F1-type ATP synthase epsilon subunit